MHGDIEPVYSRPSRTDPTVAGPAAAPGPREAAIQRFQQGDFEAAAHLLTPLLRVHPEDALLHRMHGMAFVRMGVPDQGLHSLARSMTLEPGEALCATWYGIGLHAAGRYEEAIRILAAAESLAPHDPAPLIHASRAFLKAGRPTDAQDAANRARLLAPTLAEAEHAMCLAALAMLQATGTARPDDMANAWTALGHSCARLDKVLDARAAFAEALHAQPTHVDAECALALIDHLRGQPVAAIARLQTVLDRDPGSAVARLTMSSRLLLDGQSAKAFALLDNRAAPASGVLRARWHLERAQALIALHRDPEAEAELAYVSRQGFPELKLGFHWQHLILALRQQRSDAPLLIDRVERLADMRGSGSTEQRIDAHFDLADMHHKAARRDEAFSHWRRGHALLRLAQPFSRESHGRYLDAITRSFGVDRLRGGPRAASNDETPVFIVGLPRTATTLLEQILSAHPAVHGAGERLAVREMMVRLTGTTVAADAMVAAASVDADGLTTASDDFSAELRALAPGAKRVLDKMPDNFFQLGFIATLLPAARIICCTRDLRDVGFSIFKHRFLGHHPYAHDLADLGWFMAAQQRLLTHWRSCLPMLMVDHADWIADFDATLRRILAFLDLPFDPACERFFEQDRPIGSASRAQVRRPINADGVGRWRDYADQLQPMIRALDSDLSG